jgi:hypothetical protein
MAVTKVTPAGLTTSQIGRNLIDNGAMTVDQRGGASGAANHYTLDRWLWNQSSGDTCTKSQDTTVPSGAGFGYSFKIDVTGAGGGAGSAEYDVMYHRMEGQNLQHLEYGTSSAKTLVLSFWFRSPKTGTHCVALYNEGNRSYIREFTIASADTFEYFSMTFPGDTGGTINNDTGTGLELIFPLQAGSNFQATANQWASGQDWATSNQQNLLDSTSNNIYFTGVQLEVGDGVTNAPTDFEFEDYGTTLRKCQRYLHYHTRASSVDHIFAAGKVTTTTTAEFVILHPVEMRAAPTLGGSASDDFGIRHANTTTTSTNLTNLVSGPNAACVVATVSSGLTAGQGALLFMGSDGDYIQWSADL